MLQELALNGTRISVERVGAGAGIVLLHAGAMDSRMWGPQMAPLAAERTVVRYDLRGYGASGRPTGPYSDAEDLLALLDALGLEQPTLVGLSLGGRVALDFCLLHPGRVGQLVLASSGPSGLVPSESLRQAGRALFEAFKLGPEAAVEEYLALPMLARAVARPQLRESLRSWIADNIQSLTTAAWVRTLEPPAIERLETVSPPTLVLYGDQDVPEIREIAELMAHRIPRARLLVLEGSGHMLNLEKPEEFNRMVLEFLSEATT
ncbi:MAG TPA: alpha/beta hydrolase [Vicinamibacteria bacterium]|jgi:3-oxoadipate enol-lactonase|nr:alpha/beta hydrolase [Vicinamibacteria bacterium]